MSDSLAMNIDFRGYWHAGSGRSRGGELDASVNRDQQGLPILPGRHLRGMLRDALHSVLRLNAQLLPAIAEGPAADLEVLLFGSRSHTEARRQTRPGMLIVASGQLAAADQALLAAKPELKPGLYQGLYSTAIDDKGTAKEHSLRGIEVCIPLRLIAELSLELTATEDEHRKQQQALLDSTDRWRWLDVTLPMIDSLGANRHRGLGEVRLGVA